MADPDTPLCPPLRKIRKVVKTSQQFSKYMVILVCGHVIWRKEAPDTDNVYCHKCVDDPREPILQEVISSTNEPEGYGKRHWRVILKCGHTLWLLRDPNTSSIYCPMCRNITS